MKKRGRPSTELQGINSPATKQHRLTFSIETHSAPNRSLELEALQINRTIQASHSADTETNIQNLANSVAAQPVNGSASSMSSKLGNRTSNLEVPQLRNYTKSLETSTAISCTTRGLIDKSWAALLIPGFSGAPSLLFFLSLPMGNSILWRKSPQIMSQSSNLLITLPTLLK